MERKGMSIIRRLLRPEDPTNGITNSETEIPKRTVIREPLSSRRFAIGTADEWKPSNSQPTDLNPKPEESIP